MASKKHLIIGCSSAALSALEKIRAIAPEDEIKLVTKEEYPPYSPTSLPYLLSGRITEKELPLREEDYLETLKASLALGKEVTQVLTQKKEVVYGDGSTESYDDLLIASGAKALQPSIPGLDAVGSTVFRTLSDYHRLSRELEGKKDVTILGGGLVGFELAVALLEKGYRVNIVEMEDRILPMYFDKEAASIIQEIFAQEGAQIQIGTAAEEVGRNGERIEIRLSQGSPLSADVLITAVGVRANTDFLKGSGISIQDGVLVDRRMRTDVEDVYAAGDVAQAPNFFTGQPEVNPILPSAVVQGRIAGRNMAGQDAEYEGGISMNNFNFFGYTAFSVGQAMFPATDAKILKKVDPATRSFRKLVFDQGRLVGAMFLNEEADPGVLHYLIRKRMAVSPHEERLLDSTTETGRWLMLRTEKQESMLLEV